MVWPMVPQGVSNSEVQYAREHAPSWDDEATERGTDPDLALPAPVEAEDTTR
jgi:acetolactate synthase-1/2/3 large subunit